MNKAHLIGRLTRDPDIRVAAATSMTIARFTLAVPRNKNEADFISCTAFDKTAEFAEKYLKKGMQIAVSGRIQTGSFNDRDGKRIFTTEVIVSEIDFFQNKEKQEENPAGEDQFDVPEEIDESELPYA